MKTILLFGAGKSATVLIDYLIRTGKTRGWMLIVADADLSSAKDKTRGAEHAIPVVLQVEDEQQRTDLIKKADIVISLLPPFLHSLVARDCVRWEKNLLTASYIDEDIRGLKEEIQQKGLLFLCEMGLDPGIDHISAMRIIHGIKNKGGHITSFKSHCGGLTAPESDDNCWHYKISWNPRNIVLAGKAGAEFKENDQVCRVNYESLFDACKEITVDGVGKLAYYPNRDSMRYIPLYDLDGIRTFIRTTLRHPVFCKGWHALVNAGLTNNESVLPAAGLSFKEWSKPVLPFLNEENLELLRFLGLFEEELVPASANTSADILLFLLETKLAMQPADKDMIVMRHELEYKLRDRPYNLQSTLVVKGTDSRHTAMAKTVGLPLGIATRLILEGKIRCTGLHIPIIPEIYEPVLKELEREGILFEEKNF